MRITEALAELKTIEKRVVRKRDFILEHLIRWEIMKDPLVKDGGQAEVIKRERQAIKDLEERVVKLRTAIQKANSNTDLTVGKITRTIAQWLTWRKEVSEMAVQTLSAFSGRISTVRQQAQKQGVNVLSAAMAQSSGAEVRNQDVIINVSETELLSEAEAVQQILGELDGQLSLKNATTDVEI